MRSGATAPPLAGGTWPSARPAPSSRIRAPRGPGQSGAKLWDILQPGGMHVRRHGRFRVPIALWMLTGLGSVQRGYRKNYAITVGYDVTERFLRPACRVREIQLPLGVRRAPRRRGPPAVPAPRSHRARNRARVRRTARRVARDDIPAAILRRCRRTPARSSRALSPGRFPAGLRRPGRLGKSRQHVTPDDVRYPHRRFAHPRQRLCTRSASHAIVPTASEVSASNQPLSTFSAGLPPPAVTPFRAWRNASGHSLDTSWRPSFPVSISVFCSDVDRFAAYCAPRSTPYIVQHGDRTMGRITTEDLDDCMFGDADGNVLDPAITPYVLMPGPKVRDTDRRCQLWIVTKDDPAIFPWKSRWGASTKQKERAMPPMSAWTGHRKRPTGSFSRRWEAVRHDSDPVITGRPRHHCPAGTPRPSSRSAIPETHEIAALPLVTPSPSRAAKNRLPRRSRHTWRCQRRYRNPPRALVQRGTGTGT